MFFTKYILTAIILTGSNETIHNDIAEYNTYQECTRAMSYPYRYTDLEESEIKLRRLPNEVRRKYECKSIEVFYNNIIE